MLEHQHGHAAITNAEGIIWAAAHEVQFYESDSFLTDAVATYLATGIRVGQPVVVIATPAHRKDFTNRLRVMGIDPETLVEGRDIVFLDARETLDCFMEGGQPNAELFEATVGDVFETLLRGRRYLLIRAFGEMVDLLWRDGKAQAAIELEKLWNALAAKYSFQLLCAYTEKALTTDRDGRTAAEICGTHARVLPPESPALATRIAIPNN